MRFQTSKPNTRALRLTILAAAFLLILCLTGCGKNKEVLQVETMIADLSALPTDGTLEELRDTTTKIRDINNAYDALPTEDKQNVENYSNFLSIQQTYYKNERQLLINTLRFADFNAVYVGLGVLQCWNNVSTEDFFTYYDSIFYFPDKNRSWASYAEELGSERSRDLFLWAAGCAICPKGVSGGDVTDRDAILKATSDFCTATDNVKEAVEMLDKDIEAFADAMGDVESSGVEELRQWWEESREFIEFVTDPHGNLRDFTEKVTDFNTKMSKRPEA